MEYFAEKMKTTELLRAVEIEQEMIEEPTKLRNKF